MAASLYPKIFGVTVDVIVGDVTLHEVSLFHIVHDFSISSVVVFHSDVWEVFPFLLNVAVKSLLKIAYSLTLSLQISKFDIADVAFWFVFHHTKVHPAFVAV